MSTMWKVYIIVTEVFVIVSAADLTKKCCVFTCFIYCISTFQVVIVSSGTLVTCLSKGCNILMLTNFSKSLLGLDNANCNFLLASDVLFLNYV